MIENNLPKKYQESIFNIVSGIPTHKYCKCKNSIIGDLFITTNGIYFLSSQSHNVNPLIAIKYHSRNRIM